MLYHSTNFSKSVDSLASPYSAFFRMWYSSMYCCIDKLGMIEPYSLQDYVTVRDAAERVEHPPRIGATFDPAGAAARQEIRKCLARRTGCVRAVCQPLR